MTSPSRSGVFSSSADAQVEQFAESISFDIRLYKQDIAASLAHAEMLASSGHLSPEDVTAIRKALHAIQDEIETGTFRTSTALEDIHMHIEAALTERLASQGKPDLGKRLHTARSRNDQVSTDLRLWVRDSIDELSNALRDLQCAFLNRTDQDIDVVLPAYTHLQRAQPVLANHYWLAYCEKFQRDLDRLADCRRRANQSPLGTAAVAGTSLEIDRQLTCDALGFDNPIANSLDASSDRDFVVEFVFAMSLIANHLSGWAEEWILWSTAEFGYVRLPESHCTGSSIMPQKVNPDVLELIRGKAAVTIGSLQTLLVLIKGLPLAYNRDLQEDKPPLFRSFDNVLASCQLASQIVAGMEFCRDRIASRLEEGYLDATTLMEYLIRRGAPQRVAHQLVGTIVRYAMQLRKPLAELTLEEFQRMEAGEAADGSKTFFAECVYDVLGVQNAVRTFRSLGSTAPEQVAAQVQAWKAALAK